MNRGTKIDVSKITSRTVDLAESIEAKMRRITANNEPIDSSAPLIYTEEKDGVLAGYDIRTDRFDIAIEAMDKVYASDAAKRDNAAKQAKTDSPNNEFTPITE